MGKINKNLKGRKIEIAATPKKTANIDDWSKIFNDNFHRMKNETQRIISTASKKEINNVFFSMDNIEIWHTDTDNPHPNDVLLMTYDDLLLTKSLSEILAKHPEIGEFVGLGLEDYHGNAVA